jgi:hypothetical protein
LKDPIHDAPVAERQQGFFLELHAGAFAASQNDTIDTDICRIHERLCSNTNGQRE